MAKEAQSGRLGSGVSNYTMGDIDAQEIEGLGDIESGLAESLGGIPAENYLSEQNFERQRSLAALIGSLNKKSGLMNILSGGGVGGGLAATLGAGPWGIAAGTGLGAILGGLE